MADETKNKEHKVWAMPRFYLKVHLSPSVRDVSFQEVSGMELHNKQRNPRGGEERDGTLNSWTPPTYGNIILKRGFLINNSSFWAWYNKFQMNSIPKETITILLLNADGKPTVQWTLKDAWPVNLLVPNLKPDGNEIAIERIELAHDGLTISAPTTS